ncbi:MAG: hypothetical protein EBW44_14545 [Rhodobacteraceae bacterium]|nr:hypothetical protein [Paracoccaceae bacterium]
MNLDNDYYNRDVIVVNNNDDPAVFALNEVMQGTNESIHTNDYKSRHRNFSQTLLLDVSNFRFLNHRKYEDGDSTDVREMITASAHLDASVANGISLFGTENLLNKLNIIFEPHNGSSNYISVRTKIKTKPKEKSFRVAQNERLEVYVNLAQKEYEALCHDAEINQQKSILQLEITLHENCGIYQNRENGSLKSDKNIIKILPDKILSRSELGNLAINPIDEVIFSDFSFFEKSLCKRLCRRILGRKLSLDILIIRWFCRRICVD